MKKALTLRLVINDQVFSVPTYLHGNIVIDRRVQNFEQVRSQQGVITKLSFRVPLQGVLIEAIGDLSDLTQNPSVDIRKSIQGSIIIDGQDVYNGSFQILNIYTNPKEVELIFQGNETALKAQTKDITLKELFEGETIAYDTSAINLLLDNEIDGYRYGLIDYGQNFTITGGTKELANESNPIFQTDFTPLVSLEKILELLNEKYSINVELNEVSAADLLKQFIPLHSENRLTPIVDTSPADNTGTNTTTATRRSTFSDDGSNEISLVFDTASNYNTVGFAGNSYTAQEFGKHYFNFNVGLTITSNASAGVSYTYRFGYKINGGTIVNVSNDFFFRNTASHSINLANNFPIELEDTDVVTFFLTIIQNSTDPFYTNDYDVLTGTVVSCVQSPEFNASTRILVAENFTEGMNVWDHCIKTLINQCNGVITRENDTYEIVPFNIWTNSGVDFDLNDAVVEDQKIQIQPPSTTGAKRIELKYIEDDDFYNEEYRKLENKNYGSLIIEDTGIDFATNTVTVEVPFAPTPLVRIQGSSTVIPKIYEFDGSSIETVKPKPRLLYQNGDIDQLIYMANSYAPSSVTTNTNGQIPYFGHWQSIEGGYETNDYNFGTSLVYFASSGYPNQTLYDRFWRDYILETYGINSRKVSIQCVLTQWQAINLKMNERVIYKDAEYRILGIRGIDLTNPSSPVTMDLALRKEIENIDIAPYYPFNVLNTVVQWRDSSDNSDVGDGSGEPASDIEESALAYGFFYDSAENMAIQRGQILEG